MWMYCCAGCKFGFALCTFLCTQGIQIGRTHEAVDSCWPQHRRGSGSTSLKIHWDLPGVFFLFSMPPLRSQAKLSDSIDSLGAEIKEAQCVCTCIWCLFAFDGYNASELSKSCESLSTEKTNQAAVWPCRFWRLSSLTRKLAIRTPPFLVWRLLESWGVKSMIYNTCFSRDVQLLRKQPFTGHIPQIQMTFC